MDEQSEERPCHGSSLSQHGCQDWHGGVLFYEYFNGDTGEGIGASHQTGWTALVATCIEKNQGIPQADTKQ